jgi:hypothetical protein
MTCSSLATVAAVFLLMFTPLSQRESAARPKVEVFKTATCGCCSKWIDHMKAAQFDVRFVDISHVELDKVKAKHGVPSRASSCHTALVGGYVVEGHIPASEVKRLLKERPSVVGLAVPGMPAGSPGMEVSGFQPLPYNVMSFDKQGRMRVFSTQQP